MSRMSVAHAIQRIKGAPPDSPIMVMKHDDEGFVNAVFASTVVSQQMLKIDAGQIVGVYHGGMDMSMVRKALEAAAMPTDALRV